MKIPTKRLRITLPSIIGTTLITSPNCNARTKHTQTIPVAMPEKIRYKNVFCPNPARDIPVPVRFTMYQADKNKNVPLSAAAKCEFDLCMPLFARTGEKPAKTAPSIA